jgi:hypothetical protein
MVAARSPVVSMSEREGKRVCGTDWFEEPGGQEERISVLRVPTAFVEGRLMPQFEMNLY